MGVYNSLKKIKPNYVFFFSISFCNLKQKLFIFQGGFCIFALEQSRKMKFSTYFRLTLRKSKSLSDFVVCNTSLHVLITGSYNILGLENNGKLKFSI